MPSLCPYRTSDKGKTCFVRRRAALGIAISEAARNKKREGGQRAVERTNRISFWQESRDLSAAYIERATPLEEKNLNYVIPRVNQTGSKGRRGNLVAI